MPTRTKNTRSVLSCNPTGRNSWLRWRGPTLPWSRHRETWMMYPGVVLPQRYRGFHPSTSHHKASLRSWRYGSNTQQCQLSMKVFHDPNVCKCINLTNMTPMPTMLSTQLSHTTLASSSWSNWASEFRKFLYPSSVLESTQATNWMIQLCLCVTSKT